MITIALSGDAQLAARFADFPGRLQQRLAALMARFGDELSDRIGQSRSGRFAAAPEVVITSDEESATIALGFGRSQARGSRPKFRDTVRARLGAAKRAHARPARRSSVAPAGSFLGAALAGFSDDAGQQVEAAVLDELGQ